MSIDLQQMPIDRLTPLALRELERAADEAPRYYSWGGATASHVRVPVPLLRLLIQSAKENTHG